jgi:chromosome segregation ATPase
MPLVIIRQAIGIISNRDLESDVNNMKGNFSQIQEMLKENESKLSKIENKMEENQQLLENYQQKLTDIKIKLEHVETQSKNKGPQKMKHKANMSHKMQYTPHDTWSHTDAENQEPKLMLNQILKMLQDIKDANN